MNYWWAFDNIVIFIFILLFLFIIVLTIGRVLVTKFLNFKKFLIKVKQSIKGKINSGYELQLIFFYLLLFITLLILLSIIYSSMHFIYNIIIQLQFYNLSWFYFAVLIYFSLILMYITLQRINYNYWNLDLIYTLILLIFFLLIYTIINNIFLLIFTLEAQGVIFLYFIILSQAGLRVIQITKESQDNRQVCNWILISLFTQFWSSFIGAVLLIYVGFRLGYIYGSLAWVDLNYLYFFTSITLFAYLKYLNYTVIILFVIGLLIKLGLFPYYFWKPELYKNITWELMFWYVVLYNFAILFLILNLLVIYLYYWTYNLYFFLWIFLITGFTLLAGVIFVINELKIFIAYMSIFHTFFILAGIFNNMWGGILSAYAYLLLYVLLVFYFFIIIFLYTPGSLRYLVDISLFNAYPSILFSIICAFISMGGIPPFWGFWAKISIINNLLINTELILAIISLSSGLFLLYFYLQNYRFNSTNNYTYTYTFNLKHIIYGNLIVWICILSILNFISILMVGDLWNIINLSLELSILELW